MLLEFWDLMIDLDRVRVCDDLDWIGVWGFDQMYQNRQLFQLLRFEYIGDLGDGYVDDFGNLS